MTPVVNAANAAVQLPEELTRVITDADGVAERFVRGFIPAMDAKYRAAVEDVLKEDFPHLLEDPAFIQKVCEAMTPEAIIEQPFVFLSKNPAFVDA
jgi:hypothetical protein